MTQSTPTTLYRLDDAQGALLYVGIAGNPGRRFEQHKKDKPWWGDVANIRLEHFATRVDALAAEGVAIRTENPRHNIAGRSGPATRKPGKANWFCNDCWGRERTTVELELVWEADYGAVSDDFYSSDDPHDVFDAWIAALERKGEYQRWVPIYWFVDGFGTFERAPFSYHDLMGQDFLSYFSWPTSQDGAPVNWTALPVRDAKCWFIPAAAGGWRPSPYQSALDLDLVKMAVRAERGYPSHRAPLPGDERRRMRRRQVAA